MDRMRRVGLCRRFGWLRSGASRVCIALVCIFTGILVGPSAGWAQWRLIDSFADGDFTASPAWSGDTTSFQITTSDAGTNVPTPTANNTLRLNYTTASAGTQSLSTANTNAATQQEWAWWWGRRAQAGTAANHMRFWLYANESDLESATVDGYSVRFGDDGGDDEIYLERVDNGTATAVLTGSSAVPNALTDIGFCVRVAYSNGTWWMYSSALPAVNGDGTNHLSDPTACTTLSQGSTTDSTYTPANGSLGLYCVHSSGANGRAGAECDQVYVSNSAPAAAASAPTVANPTSAGVGPTNATLGGEITATNGASVTERGVYWSTTNGFAEGTGTKDSESGTFGNGTFTRDVRGLPPGTNLYFKAFAINSAGTGYTAQASFTTLLAAPTSLSGTNIAETSFTARWDVVAGAMGYVLDVATNSAFQAGTPWINEIHYDNTGPDQDQGVEIAGPAGTDLTGWHVRHYNGSGGATISTQALAGVIDDEGNGFGAVWVDFETASPAGLQNDNEGIALINAANGVVQFLSYEGAVTASDGPANGMTAADIGVSEPTSTPVGEALQLTGTGNNYGSFTWSGPSAHSRGTLNSGQTIAGGSGHYVAGYNGRSVGDVTNASVTNLTAYSTYYCRVRATNSVTTCGNSSTQQVTTLYGFNVGDLMLVGYHADTPDGWSFVTWVSIPTGVTISVTDNGWSNTQFRAAEEVWTYTTTSALSPGAVIVCTGSVGEAGTLGGTLPISGISDLGDQLFVFNGPVSQPDFIFGLDFNDPDGWDAYADDTYKSGLPAQLNVSSGNLAVAHYDNGQYTGIRTGMVSELEAAVVDEANWTLNNGVITPDSTDFVVLPQEPTTHASGMSFANVGTTWMDVSWTSGNGTGRIVVAKSSSAVSWSPVDGVAYAANSNFTSAADVGDGNKVLYAGTGATVKVTGLTADTTYHYKVFEYNGTGSALNYYTNGTPLTGSRATVLTLNDEDSTVNGPVLGSQPNPGTIASTADTQAEAVRVFDFDIVDSGAADGVATVVTQMTVKAGSGNTANWANTIQGVRVSTNAGSSFATLGTPTIGASSLVIPVTAGNLDIPDGATMTASLYVWMKSSGLTDNVNLEFKVASPSHGFGADLSGSLFASSFGGATSRVVQVTVAATELAFTSVPASTLVGTNFTVRVRAQDENANPDVDNTASVTIGKASGSGTLSGTLNKSLAAGSNVWSDLQMDTAGTFTLSADDGGLLTDATSGNIVAYPRLNVGDVMVLGYRSDTTDGVAFATWTDLPAATELSFTDCGWSNTAAFRLGEDFLTWTAPAGGVGAGTVVVITNLPTGTATADLGTVTGNLNGLSASGDQIFIYQGDTNAPLFIFGLDYNGADTTWDANCTDSSSSALPTPLNVSSGNLAVTHVDNGQYNGTRTGTLADLRANVLNSASWTFNDNGDTFGNLNSTDFTISGAAPSVTITNPPAARWVGYANSTYAISGIANTSTVGLLSWSNSLSHATGTGAADTNWALTVSLDVGTNVITVTGTNITGLSDSDSVSLRRMQHGGSGAIVITEILQDPYNADGGDSYGEWFEIYNRSDGDINLSGWTIKDLGIDSETVIGPLVVKAKDFLVIGRSTDTAQNGNAPVDYGWGAGPSPDMALGNSDDEIVILDTGLSEVARVEYDGGPSWPDPTGSSMYLKGPDLDMNDPSNWATSTVPWPGSDGDLGSPGGDNEQGKWYKVQSIFTFR